MRKPILLILALMCTIAAQAQLSVQVDPPFVTGTGEASSPDIGAYSMVTNTSQVALNLLWSRSVISAPSEWSSWICDMNNCYLPWVDTCPESRPNELEPGQSMNIEYHAGPAGVDGRGEYMVYLYDLNEQGTILDSIHIVIETTTSGVFDAANSEIRIYPNPTTSYFQLANGTQVERIVLHSLVGNLVREFDARSTSRFDVADLPQGIYLVRLFDRSQNVLRTVRLSKR